MPIFAVITIVFLFMLVWPMLTRPAGQAASEPPPPPVDTGLMRELGYIVNTDDRWIHPWLKMWVTNPQSLAQCDRDQLEAFHSEDTWAPLEKPQQPYLSPDLGRAVREHKLQWFGWMDVWFLPNGAGILTDELERIGAHGLNELISRYMSFHQENHRRKQAGCVGMFAMFFWLVGGWQWGSEVWLLGMALIAVGSWLFRPIMEPPDLWGEVHEVNTQEAMEQGALMLGEEWKEFARATAVIPLDSDHIHMMNLDRCISVEKLQRHFSPEGILSILKWMVPVDDTLRH